ncbi:MAG: zinc-dependent metalloprotease [Ancrocorticia sp.]
MAHIDPSLAGKVSSILTGRIPQAQPQEARAVVAGLRAMARRAPNIVAAVSKMEAAPLSATVPVYILDREQWAAGTASSLEAVLGEELLAAQAGDSQGGKFRVLAGPSSALISVEVGAGLALMAKSVLGQYDPLADDGAQVPGRLVLVAPNILEFQRAFDLDQRDLALWVCVHELTHAAQFAQAPWLRDYIISRARAMVEDATGSDAALALDSGPGGDISAIMSVLEGHAEFVMNAVPIGQLPSKRRLKTAMKARRDNSSPWKKWLQRLTGMDMKMNQYAAGETFVAEVVKDVGVEGLNQLWESPLNAPSIEEIASPLTWVHRVIGTDYLGEDA